MVISCPWTEDVIVTTNIERGVFRYKTHFLDLIVVEIIFFAAICFTDECDDEFVTYDICYNICCCNIFILIEKTRDIILH